MLYSFQNETETVEANGFSADDIRETYLAVYGDHPELFYLSSASRIAEKKGSIGFERTFVSKKIFTKNEIIQYRLSMNEVVNNLSAACQKLSSEAEKVKFVCDYFIKNVRYQINNTFNQNAATVLIKNKGQCSGVSKAVKLIFDKLNIECLIVYGTAFNVVQGAFDNHSWNIVKVKGKYYHLDVTYLIGANVGKKNDYVYSYYNGSDARFSTDHKWDATKYPKCGSDDRLTEKYPVRTITSKNVEKTITSYAEFRRDIGKALDDRKDSFTFKPELPEKDLRKLAELLMKETVAVGTEKNLALKLKLSVYGTLMTIIFDWK